MNTCILSLVFGCLAGVHDGSKVLDAHLGDVAKNGGKVQLWNDNGHHQINQYWRRVGVGDGWFRLECRKGGKVLDAHYSDSEKNGCRVQLWDKLGKDQYNQHWRVIPMGNGWFQLECRKGHKVLDAHQADSRKNGCKIQLWKNLGKKQFNQHWTIVGKENGWFKLRCRAGAPQVRRRDPRCAVRRTVSGPCKALFTHYYFDGQRCRGFTYGGCEGTPLFESVTACRNACE